MNPNDPLAKMMAQGRTRYIVVYGVLFWGILTAVLFASWNFYTKKSVSTAEMIAPFVAFPLCGIIWGAAMWSIMKKKYDRRNNDRSS